MMFPFETVRPVQKNFMDDLRYAFENKRHLLAHAPTGLGKTAAVLSTALEYSIKNGNLVFFLTPKHSQHHIAVETLSNIKKKYNSNFIATDLIGKKWLCSHYGVDDLTTSEFNDLCRKLVQEEKCKYYNNSRTKSRTLTNPALKILQDCKSAQPMHAEDMKEMASEHYCTYEIATEMAKTSNLIIADYFHIFSPLRKYLLGRIGKELENSIIIVDEAHNLTDRIRDMMSKSITSKSLSGAEKEAVSLGYRELADTMREIKNILSALKSVKLKELKEAIITKDIFLEMMENRIYKVSEIIEDMAVAGEEILESKKKSYLLNTARFIESWQGEEDGYTRIIAKVRGRNERDYVSLSYKCLDPMVMSKEIIDQTHSTILMSGTLTPLEMHQSLLGFDPARTDKKIYSSPFPKKNRLNLIMTDITTKYSKRTEETFQKIAQRVAECSNSIPGNVAVFFPSYYMRDRIFNMAKDRIKKEIILEEQSVNKKELRKIYERFIACADKGAVLLGVQAGRMSEGVDYQGKFLNGVVIVGIPLEIPDLATKELINYYDRKFNRGWDYGYIFPAMIRSIQAAGRCIRSETDRGVCVFMDERFSWANYRRAFPVDLDIKITGEPSRDIKQFFGN